MFVGKERAGCILQLTVKVGAVLMEEHRYIISIFFCLLSCFQRLWNPEKIIDFFIGWVGFGAQRLEHENVTHTNRTRSEILITYW